MPRTFAIFSGVLMFLAAALIGAPNALSGPVPEHTTPNLRPREETGESVPISEVLKNKKGTFRQTRDYLDRYSNLSPTFHLARPRRQQKKAAFNTLEVIDRLRRLTREEWEEKFSGPRKETEYTPSKPGGPMHTLPQVQIPGL